MKHVFFNLEVTRMLKIYCTRETSKKFSETHFLKCTEDVCPVWGTFFLHIGSDDIENFWKSSNFNIGDPLLVIRMNFFRHVLQGTLCCILKNKTREKPRKINCSNWHSGRNLEFRLDAGAISYIWVNIPMSIFTGISRTLRVGENFLVCFFFSFPFKLHRDIWLCQPNIW